MKISENHDEIWKNRTFFSVSNLENAKKIDEHLLKYWGLGGANACKSCRSRQELSSEYFLATFGFDTADNEPDNTPPRDLIFTDIPRPLIFVQLLERADTRPGSLQSDIRICYRMRSKNIEQQRISRAAENLYRGTVHVSHDHALHVGRETKRHQKCAQRRTSKAGGC